MLMDSRVHAFQINGLNVILPNCSVVPLLLLFIHNAVTQARLQTTAGTGIPREMGRAELPLLNAYISVIITSLHHFTSNDEPQT